MERTKAYPRTLWRVIGVAVLAIGVLGYCGSDLVSGFQAGFDRGFGAG